MLREAKLLLCASAIATLGMPSISTDHSLPCQIYPISTFTAGDKLQFQYVLSTAMSFLFTTDTFMRLIGDHERSCSLVVAFSDARFLPVSLLAVPRECSGYQMATLRLPESLADGYASIQWYVFGASAVAIVSRLKCFQGNARESSQHPATCSMLLADAMIPRLLLVSARE